MRRQLFTEAFLFTVLSVGAASCGATDDPVTYKFPTFEDFCGAKAEAECTEIVQTRCSVDKDPCVKKRTAICLKSKPLDATYQPGEAEACLSKVSDAYGDDQLTPDELHSMADTCSRLFAGSLEVGASCSATYQCAPEDGVECVIPDGSAKGTCEKPSLKEAGDACGPAGSVCAEGLFCTSSEPHVCAKRYDVGQACSQTLLCKESLTCEANAADQSGTCAEKAGTGARCEGDTDCASDLCSTVRICKGDECHQEQQCTKAIILTPSDPICEQFRP